VIALMALTQSDPWTQEKSACPCAAAAQVAVPDRVPLPSRAGPKGSCASKTTPMQDNLEEERRLAFVALTRAREKIFISWADKRKPQWGETIDCKPSRFIKEMVDPDGHQLVTRLYLSSTGQK